MIGAFLRRRVNVSLCAILMPRELRLCSAKARDYKTPSLVSKTLGRVTGKHFLALLSIDPPWS